MISENASCGLSFRSKRIAFSVLKLGLLFAVTACGSSDKSVAPPVRNNSDLVAKDDRLAQLQQEVNALKDSQAQLNGLVFSDFATCPASGETADALIRKMCKVAQGANAELRLELKGELSVFAKELETQVSNLSGDVGKMMVAQADTAAQIAALNARIADAEASVKTLTTNLSNLSIRVSSAETAIVALQTSLSSLQNNIPGLLESIDIGSENVAAGPLYETILRRADRTRIVGFKVQKEAPLNLIANDPMDIVSGTDVATFTQGGESLVVGDVVNFSSCAGGGGLTARDVNGDLPVLSVGKTLAGETAFSVRVRRVRTQKGENSKLGGNLCVASKVSSRGMAVLWEVANGADATVRVASTGTQSYNYIIKQVNKDWSVCYDRKNATATFDVLNALGATVICK